MRFSLQENKVILKATKLKRKFEAKKENLL